MMPIKPTLFQECALNSGSELEILHCISNRFDEVFEANLSHQKSMRQWQFVFSGAMVFFMQAGFAMVCAGCVRKKNLHNTVLKNLLDVCGASVAFYTVGYGLAFGGQNDNNDISFMGTTNFFATGNVEPSYWFFQFVLSATAVTIVAGTLAERCKMAAYLWYSLFLTGFVYPITAHTIWSHKGILSASAADPYRGIGVIDFAGSGVIHLAGGSIALAATYILGPRKGRFYDEQGKPLDKPVEFPGHSIALQLLGTLILWFGCK
jgi:Amt family ammonium transporter